MNNVEEITRYGKRFMKMFYDPMPTNDDLSGAPIWCLGRRYESQPPPSIPSANSSPSLVASSATHISEPASSVCEDDRRINDPPVIVDRPAADEVAKEEQQQADDGGWPAPFLDDFESRIWMTYRSAFQSIPRSQDPKASGALTFAVRLRTQLGQAEGFSSDTGWGCMIRSGQSLLANALQITSLGRGELWHMSYTQRLLLICADWRIGENSQKERDILALFADDPQAPFSVHKFVEHGASACGKHPGEWFGPSATARCIQ
jgi:cysteine protease ATG4